MENLNNKNDKRNLLLISFVLIILAFFVGLFTGIYFKTFNNHYEIETRKSNDLEPKLYIENQDVNIYLIGLSNIINNHKDLKENYDNNIIPNLIKKITYNEEYDNYNIYRDFQIISQNGFSILKCKNNNKIYFSTLDNRFDSNLCDVDNKRNGETFIRTYKVLNVAPSNDGNYYYLTIRQYQLEEVEVVKIKKSLNPNIEVNKDYEFTFKFTNKNVEDNISSIFMNTTLINISYTSKTGVEQIQDSL